MPDATTDLYYNYILHIQIGTYMLLSKPKIIYLNDGCFQIWIKVKHNMLKISKKKCKKDQIIQPLNIKGLFQNLVTYLEGHSALTYSISICTQVVLQKQYQSVFIYCAITFFPFLHNIFLWVRDMEITHCITVLLSIGLGVIYKPCGQFFGSF